MKHPLIDIAYETQLRLHYHDQTVDELVYETKMADLPEQPGEQIPYVRLNQGASQPLMYIPGFGEGIVNKASFAAELSERGFDVILPGQNRKGALHDTFRGKHPAGAQARNYAAILQAEKLDETVVNFVSHSYGSFVFEALVQRIAKDKPDYFSQSRAALLAPAGVGYERSWRGLGKRWLEMLRSESDQGQQDFPDTYGLTGKASAKTLLANLPRSIGELREMRRKRLNFVYLGHKVGSLAIVGYAEDKMFPQELLEPGIAEALAAGWAAWSPVSLDKMTDGSIRGGRGATHDDEQFNPSRVAGAVQNFLKTNR